MFFRIKIPKNMQGMLLLNFRKYPQEFHELSKNPNLCLLPFPDVVVGPPMLAFDAKSSSLKSKLSTFPGPRITTWCIVTWIKANSKMEGATLITFHMLPLAPNTTKNTYIVIKMVSYGRNNQTHLWVVTCASNFNRRSSRD